MLVVSVDVALPLSADSTEAGAARLFSGLESQSDPPAAVCGEAIDVPDIVVVPPPFLVERMLAPGAQMSTHGP